MSAGHSAPKENPSPQLNQPTPQTETEPKARSANRPALWLAVLAVLFVGLNLRPAITSVAFVAPDIHAELGLGSTLTGLLTTTPLLAFVALSSRAPTWGRRQGLARMILLALGLLIVGFCLRLIPATPVLFAGMAVIGVAITIGNVLLPTYIKARYPDHSGVLMGIYTVSLYAGPTLAAAGTVPLAHAFGSWKLALFIWVILALIAIPLWLPHVSAKPLRAQAQQAPRNAALWRNPLAWAVTVYFAVLSVTFYTVSAWLPTILLDRGLSLESGSAMLMWINATAAIFALVVSVLVHRTRSQVWATVSGSVLLGAGLAGLAFAPVNTALIFALLFGIGNGVATGIAFSLALLRSANAQSTAALGAMSQTAGYALSSIGPVGAGMLHDLTESWQAVLILLIVLISTQALAGLWAGRNQQVDVLAAQQG